MMISLLRPMFFPCLQQGGASIVSGISCYIARTDGREAGEAGSGIKRHPTESDHCALCRASPSADARTVFLDMLVVFRAGPVWRKREAVLLFEMIELRVR